MEHYYAPLILDLLWDLVVDKEFFDKSSVDFKKFMKYYLLYFIFLLIDII